MPSNTATANRAGDIIPSLSYEMKSSANPAIKYSDSDSSSASVSDSVSDSVLQADTDDEDNPLTGPYHDENRDDEFDVREKEEVRARERAEAEKEKADMLWWLWRVTGAAAAYAAGSLIWFRVLS